MSQEDSFAADFKSALIVFGEVAKCLDNNRPLPWGPSGEAVRDAWFFIDMPDTIKFIDHYLFRIVMNMTQSSPSKFGLPEKRIIEETLETSVQICVKLLSDMPSMLYVLGRIFDPKIPFYYGTKSGFQMSAGYPNVRFSVARKFADLNGFSLIVTSLRGRDSPWIGCEVLYNIVQMAQSYEISHTINDKTREDFVIVLMEKVLHLPDEVVKKENTDCLSLLVQSIWSLISTLPTKDLYQERFFAFWFDCISKYIHSSSIVVKLFGWEQLADIIQEVKGVRPFAESYIIEGAGTAFVNGEYHAVPKTLGDDCLQYTKAADPANNVPLLTLFRCNMRNSKSKWWFLSQADLEKPGTEKDIDYYVHRSTFDEEREPSRLHWVNVHPGMILQGKAPSPTARRGPNIVGPNASKEDFLDYKIIQWCDEHEILSQAFNSSNMHREIVSRSIKLLQYLQEYDKLTVGKLHEIWTVGFKCRDKDIMEEIFSVIVQILATSTVDMFSAVLDIMSESLKDENGYWKIAAFLEKFSFDDFKHTNSIRSPAMIAKLLSLAWNVYSDSRFPTLSNSGFIQELLSFCFRQKGGVDIAIEKSRDCKQKIDTALGMEFLSDEKEEDVSRVLQTLLFLISKIRAHDLDAFEPDARGIIDSILQEIYRFTKKNREVLGSTDPTKYLADLRLRFQVLRKFYVVTVCDDIEPIQQLWMEVNSYPAELDEFALFLKGESDSQFEYIFVKEDMLKVFDVILCSDKIDWANAGSLTFECYRMFSCALEGWFAYLVGQVLPPKRDLPALWKICLNINPSIRKDAIDLLLNAYESFLIRDSDALNELVRVIFDALQVCSHGNSFNSARAGRVIEILEMALLKFGSGNAVAHAAKGTMSRVTFTVAYKRVSYHQSNHLDSLRYDKTGDGMAKLDMHPFHTIKMLKAKVSDAANLGNSAIITVDNTSKVLPDFARIYELGNLDGAEISVSYQLSYQQRSFDDELYGTFYNGGMGKGGEGSFGMLLTEDLVKFDLLMSLCQQSEDPELVQKIWRLLMLLPSQANMVELIRNMAIQNDPDYSTDFRSNESWKDVLLDSSKVRGTYLLQVLDYLIRPAPEAEDVSAGVEMFVESFGHSDGLSTVLTILLQTPEDLDDINFTRMAVCLHIIYSLIFSPGKNLNDSDDALDDSFSVAQQSVQLLSSITEEQASNLIDKLLFIAKGAASREDSNVVHDALVIITYVIRSPTAASQLTKKDYTRELLSTVLRNNAKRVREIACDFAIQIGRAQSVVFQWLLQDLHRLGHDDEICSELFRAMVTILNSDVDEEHRDALANLLSTRLLEYPLYRTPLKEERYVLLGYLELLDQLLQCSPELVMRTKLGGNFMTLFLKDFLLVAPDGSDNSDQEALCDTPATRAVGFRMLSRFLEFSGSYDYLLDDLQRITRLATKQMHYTWGIQVLHDIKRPDIEFIGLKNQGCTCYMNSLLQVLYMCPRFREAILSTPIRELHRTTLWHRSDVDLVGKTVFFEWASGEWRRGQVVGYDQDSKSHRVQYERLDGTLEELVSFNIHEGRLHRETGRVKIIPDDEPAGERISEREEAAYRVMEQLQRTFTFLKLSKKKYFDPRPFVEACKTLNLSFNVFHQNDASEFCDQLLDRVETASKGKYTKMDMWEDVFLKTVFGGKMLTQKIPQDCPAFVKDKDSCGLWQTPRLENYLKVELQIRGKENVEDSLEGLVQGELMDGDNKITCEVCNDKKAAVMRTCIGSLPNMLLLHLKRFDLDFQTFETVKLNSKMAFPMSINMLKYTKDGIDAGKEEDQNRANVKPEHDIDPEDYEYELQGILVHAGVAQGGHYYSFVRSYESKDLWYKFDDEDVTPFTAEEIPFQCFGGPANASSSNYDEDRTANALMLLYNKKNAPIEVIPSPQNKNLQSTSDDTSVIADNKPRDLVSGIDAYAREVHEANLQHNLTCFLVDPELHIFVRNLVHNATKTGSSEGEALAERMVQFGCSFLLDILLHFRERSAIKDYITVLRDAFVAYPKTAYWFVNHLLNGQACSWFHDYMLTCTDPLARGSFVQLLVHAISVIAPKELTAVMAALPSLNRGHAAGEDIEWTPAELCARVVQRLFDFILKSVNHVRTGDEVFALIRDLAGIPSLCYTLRSNNVISLLCYFIMPDQTPPPIKSFFDKQLGAQKAGGRVDYTHMLQNIFEAIAALIGVPQVRKVNLLQEKSYWESELVPEAREAFTKIFHESCRNGYMETYDVTLYLDKVLGVTGQKSTQVMVRNIMDRMSAHLDNRVYLEGFLAYQTENSTMNPKSVWRDLHAFGFRNDLSRAPPARDVTSRAVVATGASSPQGSDASSDPGIDEAKVVDSTATTASAEPSVAETGPLDLKENCRLALMNVYFYESGMISSPAAAKAIAQRICLGDEDASSILISQSVSKLYAIASDHTWNQIPMNSIQDFLRLLLSIQDGLQASRLAAMLVGSQFSLANVILAEKERMMISRTNDYTRNFLLDRYISFVQDLAMTPGCLDTFLSLAERDVKVRKVRGMLRLTPGINLTYDEEMRVKTSRIIVDGAGTKEVNGEYTFLMIRANAGFYERTTTFQDKTVRFTLYKCSLRSGGFQWFISITPPGHEPGTNQDIDFYFSHSKHGDFLPPTTWYRLQQSQNGAEPAPRVQVVPAEGNDDEDGVDVQDNEDYDSDRDDTDLIGDDAQFSDINDSFVSDM